jgi:hypothetical protein
MYAGLWLTRVPACYPCHQVGLGTDVAGGYSTSLLDALRQAIIASRCVSFTERDDAGKPYDALSYQVR